MMNGEYFYSSFTIKILRNIYNGRRRRTTCGTVATERNYLELIDFFGYEIGKSIFSSAVVSAVLHQPFIRFTTTLYPFCNNPSSVLPFLPTVLYYPLVRFALSDNGYEPRRVRFALSDNGYVCSPFRLYALRQRFYTFHSRLCTL